MCEHFFVVSSLPHFQAPFCVSHRESNAHNTHTFAKQNACEYFSVITTKNDFIFARHRFSYSTEWNVSNLKIPICNRLVVAADKGRTGACIGGMIFGPSESRARAPAITLAHTHASIQITLRCRVVPFFIYYFRKSGTGSIKAIKNSTENRFGGEDTIRVCFGFFPVLSFHEYCHWISMSIHII